MQIDFLGMHAFLSVVEQGGFVQAAAHLNLSQAAVSHRIRKLEEGIGVRLLARTTREVTLTDAGRALLPSVRNAVRELEQSSETLRQYASTAPRWLAFGCIPTLAVSQTVRPLAAFASAYPDLSVRVFDSPAEEVAELVESGAAAFAISLGSPTRATLVQDVFAQEPFVLVCHREHALAHAPRVTWDDLRRETLIRISLTTGNASKIDDALGAKRLELRWGYEAQSTTVALQMVFARLGVTVVPALSIQSIPDLVAVPLVEPEINRFLTVITPKDGQLSSAAEKLRDLLIDEMCTNLGRNNGMNAANKSAKRNHL